MAGAGSDPHLRSGSPGVPVLTFAAALSADLAALTTDLDEPGVSLETRLWALGETVRDAIPSFLGVTITVVVDGYPVSVTALDPDVGLTDVQASVLLPLARPGPAAVDRNGQSRRVDGHVVLYAAGLGAYTALVADLHRLGEISTDTAVLDEHLQPGNAAGGVVGLAEMTLINRAVGVLIAHGNTVEDAHALLRAHAQSNRTSPAAAAGQVLATLRPPPDAEEPTG